MPECSVFRCTSAADEIFFVEGRGEESVPVCGSHKEAMDGGEDWVFLPTEGQAGGSGVVLVGENVPWRVLAASAVRAQGNKAGLILHLTLSHSGESKDLQLLVPWEEAEVLKGMMGP